MLSCVYLSISSIETGAYVRKGIDPSAQSNKLAFNHPRSNLCESSTWTEVSMGSEHDNLFIVRRGDQRGN